MRRSTPPAVGSSAPGVRPAAGSGRSIQNVSCMSRAGCSGPKLSAVKLVQSASISGPVAVSKPMPWKIRSAARSVWRSGWIEPSAAGARPGSVRSRSVWPPLPPDAARASCASARRSSAAVRSALRRCPSARRSSAGASRSPPKRLVTAPALRPSIWTRKASTCSSVSSGAVSISRWSWAIWSSSGMGGAGGWGRRGAGGGDAKTPAGRGGRAGVFSSSARRRGAGGYAAALARSTTRAKAFGS